MSDEKPSTAVVVACLLILGGLAGWFGREALIRDGGEPGPAAAEPEPFDRERPDIFLVVVDTMRADHLPAYGYSRMTAPWITGLGQRGTWFDATSATSSWTVPSVASYLTGLLPEQHGLSGAPSATGGSDTVEIEVLSDDAVTLAERLRDNGYKTYAVVANAHMPVGSGFEQGFDEYICVGFKRAPRVQLALERLSTEIQRRRQPVFVYVHYFDPHDPFRKNVPVVYGWQQDIDRYQDQRKEDLSLAATDRRPLQALLMEDLWRRTDLGVGGAGLPYLEALYDSEIHLADDHVQLLWGDLGIDDGDVVVVTADHGEEFREHGELGHRLNLYEETLRVPLLVSWPAVWPTPRRVAERISQADLAPTLAELGGVPVADGELLAQSLVPLLDGGEWEQRYPVTAELIRTDGQHTRAIFDGSMKLIVEVDGAGRRELYDLAEDPGEENDLAPHRAEYADRLAAALEQHLAGAPALQVRRLETEVAPGVVQQLEAMGYLEERDSDEETQ